MNLNYLANLFVTKLVFVTPQTLAAEKKTRACLENAIAVYCERHRTGSTADLKLESVIRTLSERACITYEQASDLANSELSESAVRFFLELENKVLEYVLGDSEPVESAQYVCFGTKP